MAEEENNEENGAEEEAPQGNKKKKIIIIAGGAVLLIVVLAVVYFLFLSGGDEEAEAAPVAEEVAEQAVEAESASYVAMPRPFVFNVMDGKRDRLVQIKVQLMVRGNGNEVLAKKHIPLLEGTLVRVFGAASVKQLRSPAGKDQLREYALKALNEATMKLENKEVVSSVLFTGFVLQ